jgi:Na+/proline symporter
MPDLARGFLVAGAIYGVLLLTLGAVSRRRRGRDTLSDFYLADRSLGLVVLLLTLFATQYSGNSLSGFPGQTYREGLAYYMAVTFMVAIVGGYLLFAPRLRQLAREGSYLTPSDYLRERFGSPVLEGVGTVILIVTLVNFLLAQLMAMGHAISGLSGERIPYAWGVIGGGAVILAYELAGGMRAVAWTDALQGIILVAGLLVAAALLWRIVGSPAEVISAIGLVAPEKVAPPGWRTCNVWLSNFLLLGLGGPLYPQAIQRIYAARSLRDLRRALMTMAFLPHLAITTVVFVGLAGLVLFPGLSGTEADGVTFRVLAHAVEVEPLAYLPVLLVLLAVAAAIMSTADSCLLSLSSLLTRDVAARLKGLDGERAERLTGLGSLSSILVMVALVAVALRPLATLWDLLVLKFEILIQLSPAFVLGTLHRADEPGAFSARDLLAGLGAGLAVALGLTFSGHRLLWGFHAGTLGVAANYLAVVSSRRWRFR